MLATIGYKLEINLLCVSGDVSSVVPGIRSHFRGILSSYGYYTAK